MTVSPLENGRPLAIDLFCGLGGWTEGLLAEGFDVIGFDIERHVYGDQQYPAQLVLQDVCTIHGSQFKDASLIVASSPCQAYSYMAMPWSRAKQIANALRGNGAFPENYTGSRTIAELNTLFDQPARIHPRERERRAAVGRQRAVVVRLVLPLGRHSRADAEHARRPQEQRRFVVQRRLARTEGREPDYGSRRHQERLATVPERLR